MAGTLIITTDIYPDLYMQYFTSIFSYRDNICISSHPCDHSGYKMKSTKIGAAHEKSTWEDSIEEFNNQEESNIDIGGGIKPILIIMGIFGFFHFRWGPIIKNQKKRWVTIAYCFLLMMASFGMVFIQFLKIHVPNTYLVAVMVVNMVWSIQTAGNCLYLFVICWYQSKMPQLIRPWYKIDTTVSQQLVKGTRFILLSYSIILVFMVTVFTVRTVREIIDNLNNNSWQDTYSSRFVIGQNQYIILGVFEMVMQLQGFAGLIVPPAFLAALSMKQRYEMTHFISKLKLDIAKELETKIIQNRRLEYEVWAQNVESVEDVFSLYYGWNMLIGIPMACFLLYVTYFGMTLTGVSLSIGYILSLVILTTPAARMAETVSNHLHHWLLFKRIEDVFISEISFLAHYEEI